jgi:hypothetical protein
MLHCSSKALLGCAAVPCACPAMCSLDMPLDTRPPPQLDTFACNWTCLDMPLDSLVTIVYLMSRICTDCLFGILCVTCSLARRGVPGVYLLTLPGWYLEVAMNQPGVADICQIIMAYSMISPAPSTSGTRPKFGLNNRPSPYSELSHLPH